MRLSQQIILASTNRHKFEEFTTLFKNYPEIKVLEADQILRNADKLGFVERYETYLENAVAKARLANQGAHYPVLADDSGLEVMVLEGKPGVRSHRFAPPKKGIAQDQANTDQLLSQLKEKGEGVSREARFVCVLALLIEGILIHAEGTLEGTICEQPQGVHGFGYDPVFLPKGYKKTLAEMTELEKNAISHRAKALHNLMAQVKAHGLIFAKP